MFVAGIDVSGNDCRTLVGLLLAIGRDADHGLAHRIERGFSRQNPSLELSPAERDHPLGVLDDPQTSGLVELRGQFARDHRDRK